MTKEQILAFCVDRIADLLRIPKEVVDTQTKFSRLGLDSATAVYLLMDLEELRPSDGRQSLGLSRQQAYGACGLS
jgi:hypothetical protein